MLFNSLEYAIFLCFVFALYWAFGARRLRWQNLLLLAVSYLFYGLWNWHYLFLIVAITLLSYGAGLGVQRARSSGGRRAWLALCIVGSLGLLGVFKYYNFIVSQIGLFFSGGAQSMLLDVILPVGISFYTFQSIGYCCDVYMRRAEATRNLLDYATFVAFFPQLVAGPIERFTQLYPQIASRRRFDSPSAFEGLRLILWGLFKKVVIADHAAVIVDMTYADMHAFNSVSLWIAAALFSIQIYCDFSGYSDIAIGSARLLGFNLMQNFRSPYLATGIKDFWARWHISLTSWFRDYVYIPLGGNRTGHRRRNTWIVFLLSGFWHGANWTFVMWGAFHALLHDLERIVPKWVKVRASQVLSTFVLCTIGWVMFRAGDLTQAVGYIGGMFDVSRIGGLEYSSLMLAELAIAIALLFTFEAVSPDSVCPLRFAGKLRCCRFPIYLLMAVWVTVSYTSKHSFIYFQF